LPDTLTGTSHGVRHFLEVHRLTIDATAQSQYRGLTWREHVE